MRRSASKAPVDDIRALLNITLAFRNGYRGNANRLPTYADTILLAIGIHAEGTTMRDLRADYALSHSSVTRTCLALARAGLVHIVRAPGDRRRKLVKLTQRGHGIIDDVLAAYRGPTT